MFWRARKPNQHAGDPNGASLIRGGLAGKSANEGRNRGHWCFGGPLIAMHDMLMQLQAVPCPGSRPRPMTLTRRPPARNGYAHVCKVPSIAVRCRGVKLCGLIAPLIAICSIGGVRLLSCEKTDYRCLTTAKCTRRSRQRRPLSCRPPPAAPPAATASAGRAAAPRGCRSASVPAQTGAWWRVVLSGTKQQNSTAQPAQPQAAQSSTLQSPAQHLQRRRRLPRNGLQRRVLAAAAVRQDGSIQRRCQLGAV